MESKQKNKKKNSEEECLMLLTEAAVTSTRSTAMKKAFPFLFFFLDYFGPEMRLTQRDQSDQTQSGLGRSK